MTSFLVTACVLTFFSAVFGKPSFIETDSIVFPDNENNSNPSNFSTKLNECIQDSFKIEFNGGCKSLLTTDGVCQDDYWLVLDLFSASLPEPLIRGKCALRRCPDKQHYWVDRRSCVQSNESSSLCPMGNVIDTDYFGDGYCECIKQPVHARDRNGDCYPVFTRGPCPNKYVWVGTNGGMECREDNCAQTRTRFPLKTVVPWPDGKCYAVSERGPCAQGEVVFIDIWSLKPECGDPLVTLHLLSPPCSGSDVSGNCIPSVNTPQNQFLNRVTQQVSKKRTRKGISNG